MLTALVIVLLIALLLLTFSFWFFLAKNLPATSKHYTKGELFEQYCRREFGCLLNSSDGPVNFTNHTFDNDFVETTCRCLSAELFCALLTHCRFDSASYDWLNSCSEWNFSIANNASTDVKCNGLISRFTSRTYSSRLFRFTINGTVQ